MTQGKTVRSKFLILPKFKIEICPKSTENECIFSVDGDVIGLYLEQL